MVEAGKGKVRDRKAGIRIRAESREGWRSRLCLRTRHEIVKYVCIIGTCKLLRFWEFRRRPCLSGGPLALIPTKCFASGVTLLEICPKTLKSALLFHNPRSATVVVEA